MVELPAKIIFNEVLALYEGRRPNTVKPPKAEKLNFDKNAIQGKMDEMTHRILQAHHSISSDSKSVIIDDPEVKKKHVPILAEIVDDSIPLTFIAVKTFSHDKYFGLQYVTISFCLVKGRVEGDSPDALSAAWQSSLASDDKISSLEFADNGNLFNLIDRETNIKFREQGFGSMLLKTAEKFIQDNATDQQKPSISFADTAQLDVICWLYNNGYRPQTPEDALRLSEVLAGDKGITIGENYYIFNYTPEQDRIVKLPDGRTVPASRNAYRIKFVKEIPPKAASSVTLEQGKTRDAIKGV